MQGCIISHPSPQHLPSLAASLCRSLKPAATLQAPKVRAKCVLASGESGKRRFSSRDASVTSMNQRRRLTSQQEVTSRSCLSVPVTRMWICVHATKRVSRIRVLCQPFVNSRRASVNISSSRREQVCLQRRTHTQTDRERADACGSSWRREASGAAADAKGMDLEDLCGC